MFYIYLHYFNYFILRFINNFLCLERVVFIIVSKRNILKTVTNDFKMCLDKTITLGGRFALISVMNILLVNGKTESL